MIPSIYILANFRNGTLYTGVTSDLQKRVYQHKNNNFEGFTKKYECKMLVYYEILESMSDAILREKQIKAGSRIKKMKLIEALNPDWRNLYDEL